MLTYFIVLMIHGGPCPTTSCPFTPYPVTIEMPDEPTCKAVRDLNADKLALECWAKPK